MILQTVKRNFYYPQNISIYLIENGKAHEVKMETKMHIQNPS